MKRGFVSVELLIILLAVISLMPAFKSILKSVGGEVGEVIKARAALYRIKYLVEKALIEGVAQEEINFPRGELSWSDHTIVLTINNGEVKTTIPPRLNSGSESVEGYKTVLAIRRSGYVEMKVV